MEVKWNPEIEKTVEYIGNLSLGYKWMHLHAARVFAKRQRLLMYIAIFLGPISGLLSMIESVIIGTQDEPDKRTLALPIIAALLSFIISIIIAIIKFARYEELTSEHRTFAAKFASLVSNVRRQLNLEQEFRENPSDYLSWIAKNYDELFEMAPLLRGNVVEKYVVLAKKKGIPIPEMSDDVTALNLINKNKNIPMEVPDTTIDVSNTLEEMKDNTVVSSPPQRTKSNKTEEGLGDVIIDMNRYDQQRMKYELRRFMDQ